MDKKYGIIIVILFVICICLSFLLGRKLVLCEDSRSVDVDTVTYVVRDTMRIESPQPDTVFIVRTDTIRFETLRVDTITKNVYIPIERKEYRTDDYYAVIEGYKPSLLHIETYNSTVYQTKVQTFKIRPRWGFGIQVGYGTDFKRFEPYIGLGIQYNIFTW